MSSSEGAQNATSPKTDMGAPTTSLPMKQPSRRPHSGGFDRRPSAGSLVQLKLQSAIQSADRTADKPHSPTQQASFRVKGIAREVAEKAEADRSISRYRNDAAVVSFSESPSTTSSSTSSSFCYSSNFMPGVHFYTFLASEDPIEKKVDVDVPLRDSANRVRLQNIKSNGSMITRKVSALKMWIPDTIVYGETGRAIWLHSDEDGFVRRSTEVSDKLVIERLINSCGAMDLDPIVVCKEPTTASVSRHSVTEKTGLAYQGNLLRLLSPTELKTVLNNVSSARSNKSFALQKFVRCNGSRAFIVRAVHEADKPSYAWMISNTAPMVAPTPTVSQVLLSLGQETSAQNLPPPPRSGSLAVLAPNATQLSSPTNEALLEATSGDLSAGAVNATAPLASRVCTSVQVDKTCTFIKLSERGCTTVSELNQRLVKYIEHRLHVQLQTLVTDFVKDTDGRWWLLQVKHFRVRHKPDSINPYFSLPRRLRRVYLGYRDSSIVEEATDSDDEHNRERLVAKLATQFTQRHVRKLSQCKCCLAAYPKSELSFKMTLKMINEMLVRIRSRLPPEKTYTFLASALSRESPDPSLAYESWSVCSYCYAIYERDQQLQKVESSFSKILGTPDRDLVPLGLGKLDERAAAIDPSASSVVFPAQLTLCRLMLVINGIYDIPPELYEAERDRSCLHATATEPTFSRLYLRIAALGYTECIPVDPKAIEVSCEKAPRGTRRRRSSMMSEADNSDYDPDDPDTNNENPRRPPLNHSDGQNYWLPLNLMRTIHFFAPRTPLHAKLKETSGLNPFLNEDNSISIQFIRAAEPPLHDPVPVVTSLAERGRIRRTAIQPHPNASKLDFGIPVYSQPAAKHSVLLGATKIRMAQFRSAYVTKLDFYACMALTGEMFNIKGNIGLERVRYVDTKLITSRNRLRIYNGVYIPDESYVPSDPLTSEWMDCLRAVVAPASPNSKVGIRRDRIKTDAHALLKGNGASKSQISAGSKTIAPATHDIDMDEELEDMIEDAFSEAKSIESEGSSAFTKTQSLTAAYPEDKYVVSLSSAVRHKPSTLMLDQTCQAHGIAPRASEIDSQMLMLMTKAVVLPKKGTPTLPGDAGVETSSCNHVLWSFVVQLNHIHNLQSRERPYCRWECFYDLFGQRRSALERSVSTGRQVCTSLSSDIHSIPTNSSETVEPLEVKFNCAHKFFLSATTAMLGAHFRSNPTITLHMRNDVYSSTRSQTAGEFFCSLDISQIVTSDSPIDATVEIQPGPRAQELTPREAASVSRSPPYLSLSVQLTQLALWPQDAVASGDFVIIGSTTEGIKVLKKIT